jgi:5-methylcytosine-specific restriction endonuclease McrA
VLEKVCKGCGELKPLDAFYRCSKVRDGRKPRCKECSSAESRQWRLANPDKQKRSTQRWRDANDAAYRAKKRETDKAYRLANIDAIKARRQSQKEYHAQRLAEWKAANRERVRDYERKRRAAKRNAPIESMDLDLVRERSGGLCAICSAPLDWSIPWPERMSVSLDHIVPLSRGGAHATDNARYVHLVCNLSKNNRLDSEMTSAVLPRSGTRP